MNSNSKVGILLSTLFSLSATTAIAAGHPHDSLGAAAGIQQGITGRISAALAAGTASNSKAADDSFSLSIPRSIATGVIGAISGAFINTAVEASCADGASTEIVIAAGSMLFAESAALAASLAVR
jgi:hypothetical protein